jgi:hypothetical protein
VRPSRTDEFSSPFLRECFLIMHLSNGDTHQNPTLIRDNNTEPIPVQQKPNVNFISDFINDSFDL